MPEKTNNINKIENDCEKVKFMADEYLHGEFSDLSEETDFIEKHIIDCKECFDYIAEEKIYLDEIKSAEYVPEISISKSVMDKIIEEKRIIGKPPRKRFIPIGFLSAAAVVVIMFMIARGGPLKLFMKNSQDNIGENNNNNIDIDMHVENAQFDAFYAGEAADDNGEEIGGSVLLNDEQTTQAQIQPFGAAMGKMLPDAATGEAGETEEAQAEFQVAETPAPEADASPAAFAADVPAEYVIPEAVSEADSMFRVEEMDEHIPKISGLDMSEIYEIYYVPGYQKAIDRPNIIKDIEIYKTDEEFLMFDIIDKKYKDALNQNLEENNIAISEILSKNKDGEYIAVVYWFN